MNDDAPKASFAKTYMSVWAITGLLCLIFGAPLILPILFLIAFILLPIIAVVCIVKFVTSIAVDEVNRKNNDSE